MCKECGRHICPSGCPGFDHKLAGKGRAVASCALCGEAIYPDERYYRRGRAVMCGSCGESVDLDGLRELCGTEEVLMIFGFEKAL